MEDVTVPEGLLESVFPGSVTFDENILAPLHNNYLYKESKECFTYNSAYLIHNSALQKQYAAFRTQKREQGYSEQELEESFGFLLCDDLNKAKKVGETGLLVGQGKCTTLGDSTKGVYISKYSDCVDLKRWYNGKTGYIVLVKLTKGRVKEVTDNYTQNFTPPTAGFDCHVSEQLEAVTSTTSSFLAYERTQYYLYELIGGSTETEPCPRQACPFAVVSFSYGATAAASGLEEQRQQKTVFRYKPWIGQLKIESLIYDVGLQSDSGAWFPAKLPRTVKIDRAIGVSELKRTLPQEIFETCIVGEVCIDGRCFNLYDVVSSKAKSDLAQITQELKEKDLALVIPLNDSGFLILLHSSHLFSYEDAKSGKAAALQGMFIFPDSRIVPRDAKNDPPKRAVSSDVIQVLPALNYAETEMEKCPADQQRGPHFTVERHLQNYGTLIQPGLVDASTRETSMFPDQFDEPSGFTLIAPKWSQDTGTRLKSYFDEPCGFTVPVVRALELLTAGRQQCGDDDDDVYYYISSPEEVTQRHSDVAMEITEQTDGCRASNLLLNNVSHSEVGHKRPQTVQDTQEPAKVTVTKSVSERLTSTLSSKLGDVSTVNCANAGEMVVTSKETCGQTSSTHLTTSEEGGAAVSRKLEDSSHPTNTMTDPHKKIDWRSLPRRRGRKRKMHRKTTQVQKKLVLPASRLPLTSAVTSTEDTMEDSRKDQNESQSQSETVAAILISQRPHFISRGRGRRRGGVSRHLSETRNEPAAFKSTGVTTCVSAETVCDLNIKTESSLSSLKRDWRSLPRRKRLWKADVNLKRCLRSDALKNSNNDSIGFESSIDATEESLCSTPKKKMDRLNLKERYGLKNIVTKCGRIFVPHGSDVADEDVESSNMEANEITNEKMFVEVSVDSKADVISPVENKPTEIRERRGEFSSPISECENSSVQLVLPIKTVDKHHKRNLSETEKCHQPVTTTFSEAECFQHTNKDLSIHVRADKMTSPSRVPDQSISALPKLHSPEKTRKKSKHAVYSAISISKLKTVLRRGRMSNSPSSTDGTSEPRNEEPEKRKSGDIMDLSLDNDRKEELKEKESQPNSVSHGRHEPKKSSQRIKEEPVSWRGLLNKTSKENGPINVHRPAPSETVKSFPVGDRVPGISSDVTSSTEKPMTGVTPPSDALSLLADLALGAGTNKTLADFKSTPGLQTPAGSAESVLHALLSYPSTKLKLPPRSPFPEGLLVTGELVLEISKEHSYSQPTSQLSDLSGTCPPVCSPSGYVDSPLSLRAGLHLNLPVTAATSLYPNKSGKTEWKCLISPNGPLPSNIKLKTRRSRISRNRRVIEKEGSIQVVRSWTDAYDFKYDSILTNNSLDKTVMRALHGKWNFDIEDNYEELHLIFHMWIGLFYSNSTSRLFQLDNSTALPKEKSPKLQQGGGSAEAPVSQLNIELNLEQEPPKPLHRASEILDLSVKNCEPVNLHLAPEQQRQEDTVSPHVPVSPPQHPETSRSSGPNLTALMKHRSPVDSEDIDDVVSDNEDEPEEDNDCSYTLIHSILEENSAYNMLCEQASHMHLGVPTHPQVPKVINVFKTVAPIQKAASFNPRLFPQVISPIKPSFSKCPGLVLGRKRLDQSCKDETGEEECEVHQKEGESVRTEIKASFEAQRTQAGCPVSAGDKNVDQTLEMTSVAGATVSVQNESVSETKDSKDSVTEMKDSKEVSDEDSEDGCLTIVEDKTLEENRTPKSSSRAQSAAAESEEIPHAEGHFNPSLDFKDHTDKCDSCVDELKDISSRETRAEEKNEMVNTKGELESLLDLKDHVNVVDTSCHSVEGNSTEEPVEDRDENCTVQEIVQERWSRSEESSKLDSSDSDSEMPTTVGRHLDGIDLDLMDNMDSADMEISDEDEEILDVNSPSVKPFVTEPINCDSNSQNHDLKVEKSEKTGDYFPEETDHVSCPEDVSILTCQTTSVEDKTTTAFKNDHSAEMQNKSENISPEQRTVVQEAVDLCDVELKSTSVSESRDLELSHSEEKDLGQQNTTTNDENESDTQIQTCNDRVIDTYQKSPQICAPPKSSVPQAVAKASEGEINSTTSSPSHDEVSHVPEISECFKEVSDVYPEEPGWKKNKNTDTVDFVKGYFTAPTDHLSSENPEIQCKRKLRPTSQQDQQVNLTESVSSDLCEPSYRGYDVDDLHGYYQDPSYDEHLWWPECKTDRPGSHRFDEDYPFDEECDVSYLPSCSVYDTSEVLDDSCKPKKKQKGSFSWAKKSYRSKPLSTGDSERRGDRFKGQTKVTYSPQYSCTVDVPDPTPEKRSRGSRFTEPLSAEWDEDWLSCTVDYRKTSRFETYQTKPARTVKVNSLSHHRGSKQQFDWRRYFTREAASRQLYGSDEDSEGCNIFDVSPSSIVTVLDKKGNRVTFDNSTVTHSATMKASADTSRRTTESKDSLNHCQDQQNKVDMTQSALDLDYLIFSEKLNNILRRSKSSVSVRSRCRSSTTLPAMVYCPDLSKLESSSELCAAQPSLSKLKIKVDLSGRKPSVRKQRHFSEASSEEECFSISETSEQFASDRSRINDVSLKKTPQKTQAIKRKWGQDSSSQQPGSSESIKKNTFDNLHDNLNVSERPQFNVMYRFYVHVTSADTFFEETKNLLMQEGHTPVGPDEFDLSSSGQSPLLIILRNEDIAEHIFEVPCLLELKKSSSVTFAGVDRPDDVVNLTHRELFANGGLIVCDELAFDTLTLDNMKKVVGILEELGGWKWFLHYKDSRKLRESARSSHEASKKQRFIDCCMEAGTVEVLPYHNCDVVSRGQDYLSCLTHLQVQNTCVRFPVFITDTPDDSFEENGILTMNMYRFAQILTQDTCSVS